jgi:hypothetical protein
LKGGSVLENAGTLILHDNANLGRCSSNPGNEIINDAVGTITYTGSSSSATASILGPFQDSGTVYVGEGTLDLQTYGPAASSSLGVGVSATPGQLSVSGTAALTGTLAITNKTGYLPPIGTQVTVLTASSVSGAFASVTGAQLTGEHWVVSYTATSVILTAKSG